MGFSNWHAHKVLPEVTEIPFPSVREDPLCLWQIWGGPRAALLCFCSRSCPECRVISEFVIPSVYWVEEQEKKNELIEAFKQGVG